MLLNRIKTWFSPSGRQSGRRRGVSLTPVDVLEPRQLLSAVTVNFGATKDTTIYNGEADLSNGQGEFIVAASASRGLVQFDIGAGSIPDGSVILDAVLTMNVGYSEGGQTGVSVQRIATSWGEAGSNASGNETTGAPADKFDATWLFSSYDGELWNSPGGDVSGGGTSATVGDVGAYEWIGSGLVNDVQAWVDGISPNFGWLVEAVGGVKAFVSSNAPGGGLAPTLEVTYEAPPEPRGIVEGRLWNDTNTDGKPADGSVASLNLQIFRQTHFNAFGGQEYWFRSASDQSWYFLTPDARLTKWDLTGGELTGDTVTTLDPKFYYNPSLVVQPVPEPESWLDGHTVELLDSEGSVIAATITEGRDLNNDGTIDPETEGGWYRFEGVARDQAYTVRQMLPEGWKESGQIEVNLDTGTEDLINSLGLQVKESYYQNFGGQNEKWIHSETNGWYFVLPGGNLVRWNSHPITAESPLAGTLVANVGAAGFEDPSILTNGAYQEDNFTEGELLFRVDFGAFLSQPVTGRVWLDFYANGRRDASTHLPDAFPDYDLKPGESWFYDEPSDDWYIIDVDGEPTYWGKTPEDDGGSGPPFASDALFQIEPWLNNRTVELLDVHGQVVAVTTTRSIDLNGDGTIEYDTERGHYVFEDITPGEYTIRTVSDESWQQTSPITAAQSEAIRLDAAHGFRSTESDFLNWGGRNERWLIDAIGRWYFILSDGSLYEWTVGTGNSSPLEGTKIADFSADYYSDISKLTAPNSESTTITVTLEGVSDELLFGNHRVLGDLLTSNV